MSTSLIKNILLVIGLVFLQSCKKEVVNQYEIDEISLYSSASEKKNLKSDEQFIAILYSDVYGKPISNSEMKDLNRAYASIGDKSLVIDIMIKSMLADGDAEIAPYNEMRLDTEGFVTATYRRFLVRRPTPQESWFLENEIKNDPSLQPIDIYYAMLSCEEYRYY